MMMMMMRAAESRVRNEGAVCLFFMANSMIESIGYGKGEDCWKMEKSLPTKKLAYTNCEDHWIYI